jgi:hypothetical protein
MMPEELSNAIADADGAVHRRLRAFLQVASVAFRAIEHEPTLTSEDSPLAKDVREIKAPQPIQIAAYVGSLVIDPDDAGV